MPKGAKKLNKKKAKEQVSKHPLSATRPERPTTVAARQEAVCADPTPELLYRLGKIDAREFARRRLGPKPNEQRECDRHAAIDAEYERIMSQQIPAGPTCQIEWLAWSNRLSAREADAVSRWASLLARAGFLGKGPSAMGTEPQGEDGMPDEKRAEAMRQVKAVWRELESEEIRHLGRVCRQERTYNIGHVRNGAKTLARVLIGGVQKKLDRYARSA